jgi:LacI family transcriptional regulator
LVKLKDIAEVAGVSVSTVSRTLTNQSGVSNKLRAKVIDAAKQLGYPVKPYLGETSSFSNYKPKGIIGVTGDPMHNPFFYEVFSAVEAYANSRGYTVMHWNAQSVWKDVNAFINTIRYHQFSGMVCISIEIPEPVEEFIKSSQFPCITVGRYMKSRLIDSVTADNINGSVIATEQIINHGHERVLFIGGPHESTASIDRARGYMEVMNRHGLFDNSLVFFTSLNYVSGYKTTMAALKQGLKFTAIFAASDIIAIGVLDALTKNNLRVPDDISVVGFDNIEMSNYNIFKLTTVNQPKKEQGLVAAERILQLVENSTINQRQHIVLPAEFIPRNTLQPIRPKARA